MMTNEERAEVARRLRSVDPRTKLEGVELVAKWYEALCAAVGGKRDPWMGIRALCDRLADLIEPEPERTCHVEYKCRKGDIWPRAVCSVCGHDLSHCDAVDDCGEDAVELCPYCPNCGAKAVAE